MLAPKGFEQQLTEELYVQGHRVADNTKGALRYTFPMSFLAAAFVGFAARAFWTAAVQPTMLSYWLSGTLILLTGLGIAAVWLFVLPRLSRKKAEAGFSLYQSLYGRTTVTFTQDEMMVAGERLTRRVEFAKTRLCVETATLFVVFTDDDAIVILSKEAFAEAQETTAFLRDVFARWYKKKG